MMTVVKVQKPIFPPNGLWLIYDEHQKHVTQVSYDTLDRNVRGSFKGTSKGKVYFFAEWDGENWCNFSWTVDKDW